MVVRGTINDSNEVDGRVYSTDSEYDAVHLGYDKNYNTIPTYETLLSQPGGPTPTGDESRIAGKSSSFFCSYNVICTVVGTGLLQLPFGLAESGWIGVFLLLGMCLLATYTAITLIKCMNPPSGRKLYTYSEIGVEAFGPAGGYVVDIMLHATLLGVATIYLILAGGNLSTLLSQFPLKSASSTNYVDDIVTISPAWCIIIVALLMWGHVWLGTLHEVGFMSAFNVLVAVFLSVVVLLEIFMNMPPDRPDHEMINTSQYGLSLAAAWVSFAFSFGAHAILPTVYETMRKPEQFNVMIGGTFGVVLCFYLPMAIVGYYAYGEDTQSPIYDNLCDSACTFGQQLGKWLAIFAVTVHVMLSFAIILNPTELALERMAGVEKLKQGRAVKKLIGVTLRTIIVIICVGVAEVIPDFGDFLNLVSSLTNTATSFVLPCLFHIVLFWPTLKKNYFVLGIDIAIIIIATIAGFFGAVQASAAILCHVFGVNTFLTSTLTCVSVF